jgi:hypothetical protein
MKTELFLVELTMDDDLDGEAILEHCDLAKYIVIERLPDDSLKEYFYRMELDALHGAN